MASTILISRLPTTISCGRSCISMAQVIDDGTHTGTTYHYVVHLGCSHTGVQTWLHTGLVHFHVQVGWQGCPSYDAKLDGIVLIQRKFDSSTIPAKPKRPIAAGDAYTDKREAVSGSSMKNSLAW